MTLPIVARQLVSHHRGAAFVTLGVITTRQSVRLAWLVLFGSPHPPPALRCDARLPKSVADRKAAAAVFNFIKAPPRLRQQVVHCADCHRKASQATVKGPIILGQISAGGGTRCLSLCPYVHTQQLIGIAI